MDNIGLHDSVSFQVERDPSNRPPLAKLAMRGRFLVEHLRDGQVIGQYSAPNGIVDVGLNHILETQFRSGTQVTSWFIGLIDNSGFSALSNSDTMSSHSGWSESTAYSNANRPQWTPGAASGRQITNSTTVDFSINATATIKGIFVTSSNVKGGTSGTLWATAAFGANVPVQNGDTLKITYTVSG
jgi:hypothetical protein